MSTFRLGFVTGATPDKWARTWRERERDQLEVVPMDEAVQEHDLREGALDMALVRVPVDRDGLHLIPLYEEVQVAVMGVENAVSLLDEVTLEDLDDEQLVLPHRSGWRPTADQLDWPPMSESDAVETVAAGTGIAILPMSVARLHQRRDVTTRPVTDLESTTIGLSWLMTNEDPRVQTFIGIVRGRSERSSRG